MKYLQTKRFYLITIMLGILFTAQANADSTTVKIIHIGSDISANELISIQFDRDIINGVCERNDVLMFDPRNPAQQVMIAASLTSMLNGNYVIVRDSGTCPYVFNGKTVGQYELMKH